MNAPERKLSGPAIAWRLIGMVKPMAGVMALAILSGSLGHMAAIAIPTMGIWSLAHLSLGGALPLRTVFIALLAAGVLRAFLHYGEQLANHYIAFKILAIIRDKMFRALRRLAPAKLEGRDSGTLISMITSDIELLEVFYAHTISPVAIALIVSSAMLVFLGGWHMSYALLALFFYLVLGILVPVITDRLGRNAGLRQREDLSRLNSLILDSFRGIRECIQFSAGEKRLAQVQSASRVLTNSARRLTRINAANISLSTSVVLLAYLMVILLAAALYRSGAVTWVGALVPTVAFMSSFGPVLALSALANHLLLTFACGERVLALMDEAPAVEEKEGRKIERFDKLAMDHLSFGYDDRAVLKDCSLAVKKGEILGISGPSGCGKSTILKLMMRFYDPDRGRVLLNKEDLKDFDTHALRTLEGYMTQSTHLFHDSLRENVRLAKLDATDAEVEAACCKAAIHDTIMSFPEGYETSAGALGDRLSAGERQRIGLARAFLHDGGLTLFDEPTANIDALNEGLILKAIRKESQEKAMVIVSHRSSTLRIADRLLEV